MPILRLVLAAFFTAAGIMHFARPKPYRAIVPPYVPRPDDAVAVSGIAEIAGGLGLLSHRTRRLAGWWLQGLLISVFPANVHMAVDAKQVARMERIGVKRWMLWARLPLQPLLMVLVRMASRKR